MHLLKQKKTKMCLEMVSWSSVFFFFDKQREFNETELAKQPQKEYTRCIQQVAQDLYKRNKKHKHHKLRS